MLFGAFLSNWSMCSVFFGVSTVLVKELFLNHIDVCVQVAQVFKSCSSKNLTWPLYIGLWVMITFICTHMTWHWLLYLGVCRHSPSTCSSSSFQSARVLCKLYMECCFYRVLVFFYLLLGIFLPLGWLLAVLALSFQFQISKIVFLGKLF